MDKKILSWSVFVEVNCTKVVEITQDSISGKRELSVTDLQLIRDCAKHLLVFVGRNEVNELEGKQNNMSKEKWLATPTMQTLHLYNPEERLASDPL